MYLYLDTTTTIQYGILNEKFEWIDFKCVDSNRSSAELHYLMYELNKKNDIKLNQIIKVFYGAGPGSYTGMRVSEGVVNILDWQGYRFNSFYHFEIPRFCGYESGVWIAKAFKGEYFVYYWDGALNGYKLLKEIDLHLFLASNDKTVFANEIFLEDKQYVNTNDLICLNSQAVFSTVNSNNETKELFYYRPLDMEFTRAK